LFHPQHEFESHPQVGSPPRIAPLMTAAAQPTPAFTVSAPAAQFLAQAPHSMQASKSAIRAFRFSTANTACGQISTHIPHPVHLA
jgi:hypothetical protein